MLTPHVVRSPSSGGGNKAQALTEDAVNRLSLPESLLEQIRKGQLEGRGQMDEQGGERRAEEKPK